MWGIGGRAGSWTLHVSIRGAADLLRPRLCNLVSRGPGAWAPPAAQGLRAITGRAPAQRDSMEELPPGQSSTPGRGGGAERVQGRGQNSLRGREPRLAAHAPRRTKPLSLPERGHFTGTGPLRKHAPGSARSQPTPHWRRNKDWTQPGFKRVLQVESNRKKP
ncbi:hypothetical protein NDU88_002758 [Pleurodeles waltl]|uniref:Uncharacterized protein n=1 Tax=Pleurodeles waltl TaxID=8319 RepID=A0AAV7M1K4_PLEWA|nr:hypothetical protein NDU88_002758 [Pleurodeles waltl]